jgi:hypothetical protein
LIHLKHKSQNRKRLPVGAIHWITFFCVVIGCALQGVSAEAQRPADWADPVPDVPGFTNLYRVTPALYRADQPLKEGLMFMEEQHPLEPGGLPVKTVISLRVLHHDRPIARAGATLRYEHIWFKTWHPENEDVVKFLRIVTTPNLQPVLVHCHYGADRTGLMVALYRIAVQGWPKDSAIREMTHGGYNFHRSWEKQYTDYIKNVDVDSLKAQVEGHPWP